MASSGTPAGFSASGDQLGHCLALTVKREFGWAAGPFADRNRALPVGDRRPLRQAFPPGLVVGGDRDIGEDRVAIEHGERVRVGLGTGAGRDAEVAGFRIDRVQATVRTGLHPADVVADGEDLPAVLPIAFRRNQHREVGLAAGARERRRDVAGLALRVLDADDQHVLGQPTFLARLPAGDAQRMALLAQQRIAAIAGAVGLDRQLFREMHDVASLGVELAGGVQALDETAFALDPRLRRRAHARHQAHVGHDIGLNR
jgi:hypothetical protein